MPLTDTAIRQAKPQDKPYKLTDERGLFLLVQPIGSKLWRFKYRYQGKEKLLALGKYPDVGLAAARKLRDAARERLAADEDPGAARKVTRQAAKVAADNTFEAAARAWWEKWRTNRTEGTADGAIRSLEIHVFPRIGAMPITAIGPVDVLELLRKIEAKGSTETLKRVRARIGEIYVYAIANGIATSNPTEGLHKAVKPHTSHRRPALRATDLREFFIRLDAVRISVPIKLAIRLLVLTFVRPGELRCAQWPEFDLEAGVWTVPAERDRARGLTGMKMREEHIVPLSRQAVAVLRELQDHSGGRDLLFPNRNGQGRPISDGTINSALRAMGYQAQEVTGAGFRATATGALLELGYRPDVIDKQLAHRERKQVFAAYSHHAQFLPERTRMMQAWADHLDALRKGARIIPFPEAAAG
ncbi:tyrosine-type recombinase/integrase [Thauera aromatica]|nr:integrase arm-type DNA-binding domain-containing protein [Thauera aromatica]MCK2127998.1 tyrosine-type recombinase/integrase [Thauera aromatica]